MNVTARLDGLRNCHPGCSLVVFGDLFSQITLCASARDKHPQERLDALCVTAGNLLGGPAAEAAASALGMPDGSALNQAIVLSPTDTQTYLRSPVDEADVLCMVGSVNANADQTCTGARAVLSQLAQEK